RSQWPRERRSVRGSAGADAQQALEAPARTAGRTWSTVSGREQATAPLAAWAHEGYVCLRQLAAGSSRLSALRYCTQAQCEDYCRQLRAASFPMSRRRWIADESHGDTAALTGEHAAHLTRVLRAEIGQQFDIATGGSLRLGTITSMSEDR